MKTLSMFSKSIVMALGMAAVGGATISVVQAATPNIKVSEAVAAAQSKISLEQAIGKQQRRHGLAGATGAADADLDCDLASFCLFELKWMMGCNRHQL